MNGAGSRRKGATFERLIRQWFDDSDELHVDQRQHIGTDEADIEVVGYPTSHNGSEWEMRLVVECKNHRSIDLPGWWRQAVDQAKRRGTGWPVLVVKRRGKTDPGDQWVVMSLDTFTELIEELTQ